ncbi:hypothetical protein BH09PLA1_BH09PLA1_04460 [soil metagenome]
MRIRSIGLIAATIVGLVFAAGCKVVNDDANAGDSKTEQRVEVNTLPVNVTAAVKGAMPNGTITEAEKEMRNGKLVYSLDVKDGGKEYDVVVSPDGQILSTKQDPTAKP